MAKITYDFRGALAPVFTRFSEDAQTVLYDKVDTYAKYLKDSEISGVLVNGSTGEGTCMRIDERIRSAEVWREACTKYGLSMMVQVGGTSILDVFKLAAHAQSIKVDAILCLPELYFKPRTEEALVRYLKKVSEHCPNTPLVYYHIPSWSGVDLHAPRICELAEEAIPSFAGIKYTSPDLEIAQACQKPGRCIFLGNETLLSPALALGFDSTCMTTLSIHPEQSIKIFKLIADRKMDEGTREQRELTRRLYAILQDGEWVGQMKKEFNRVHPELHAGPCRRPDTL